MWWSCREDNPELVRYPLEVLSLIPLLAAENCSDSFLVLLEDLDRQTVVSQNPRVHGGAFFSPEFVDFHRKQVVT